jgi:hypothetical protein
LICKYLFNKEEERMWFAEEIAEALARACPHAIPSSFPKPGSPHYRGFEVCPYCGRTAPMFVRFVRNAGEEAGSGAEDILRDAWQDLLSGRHTRKGGPSVYMGPVRGKPAGLDLDLMYLAHLTEAGLKPLSRVERDITPTEEQLLRGLGLNVARVTRAALNGNRVVHGVFSRNREVLEGYLGYFDDRSLEKTYDVIALEGIYFGFPICCVLAFANQETRHKPNGLALKDQAILYHWACPDCVRTREIVPEYRRVWERVQKIC